MHFSSPHVRRKTSGFSLVELMVVVAIVGVLMAIALPGYREYVIRANRDAAKAVLLEIVSREEQYAASNRAYTTDVTGTGTTSLRMTVPEDVSSKYTIAVTVSVWCNPSTASTCPPLPTASDYSTVQVMTGFTATATPIAGTTQANDGTLSINQFGLKTRTVGGTTTSW